MTVIRPDAVRVWRGYRAPALPLPDFFAKLGTVFVPATVKMQIDIGLEGYIPSVPAGLSGKPDSVPDETAILFWGDQQTYTDGFKTLAVRTYTLTHGGVYRIPPSGADFPTLFAGQLASEKPCYLIDKPADWMHGQVQHLIGGRPKATTPDDFRAQIAAVLGQTQKQGKIAGAVACAGDEYLVYWELAGNGGSAIDGLTKLLDWSKLIAPASTNLPIGLWDTWPGMTVNAGDSFNMNFKRRWEKPGPRPEPVSPDAVHVWRGFKAAQKSDADFAKFLGQVFVPSCALLQPNAGLQAYVPALVTQPGKPSGTPDQTALMFWRDQPTYQDAFNKVAVRAYTNLHGDAYDTKISSAQFPKAFALPMVAEQPYYLIGKPADWMLGSVRHFVGARPAAQASPDFLAAVSKWAATYQGKIATGVDGALLCAGNDYVVFWEHRTSGNGAPLDDLAKLAPPCLNKDAEIYAMPATLWQDWPGIDLTQHDCINIQLARPAR